MIELFKYNQYESLSKISYFLANRDKGLMIFKKPIGVNPFRLFQAGAIFKHFEISSEPFYD